MSGGWVLPGAAAALWAGILLQVAVHRVAPAPATLSAGVAGLLAAGLLAARPAVRPGPLEEVGLIGPPPGPVAALASGGARQGRAPPWIAPLSCLVAAFLVGAGWAGVKADALDHSFLARLAPASATVDGSLRTDPKASPFGWSALLGVSRVEWNGSAVTLNEAVWVQGNGSAPRAARGDRVRISGTIDRPEAGDFADYLRSTGVVVEMRVGDFLRDGPSSNPIVRLAGSARTLLRGSIERLFGPKEAGLLMGLALGDTSGLDPGVERDFRATGLGHLLAVSGENVVMVLAPVVALSMLLGLRPWPRFLLGAGTVVFFVVLTGVQPSVLRAGVMSVLGLAAVLMGRQRDGWTIVGGAVLLLLLIDPSLVNSIGFQLSVAATVGMVALATPLADGLGRHLPRSVALALGTSLAAQLGVSPVLLYRFHWVPGVTIPANLLAFPAVAPALLLGLAAAALGRIATPVGWVIARLAELPMRYLEGLADRMATAPVPSITGGGWVVLVGGALLVLLLARWLHSGRRPSGKAVFAGALILPLFVWGTALRAGTPSGLVVRFLDIGQGDATLVTSPGGANILIDGGPDSELVATKLAGLGVRRLDVVVATHAHADHVEGLPEVLSRFPVGLVLDPGCDETTPSYDTFKDAVRDEGIPVRHPFAGDELAVGDLTLDFLSPSVCYSGTNSDANNDSLVIRLVYREDVVLLPGDAEQSAQQAMLDQGYDVRADILKVPHHGGATSLPEFFQAVNAQLDVISVGQPNDYGHPKAETLAELDATGGQVMRTDEEGDVTVRFGPEGIGVESAAT